MIWDGVRFLEFGGRGKGLGPSVRLLKEITRRAMIKPHCSSIRGLRMMVFKNDPYLTWTPPCKLGKPVANDTFSVCFFYDGLGWVSVSGSFGKWKEVLGKGKRSRTLGPPTKGDHLVLMCAIIKPHCSRIRPLSPTVRGMRVFDRSLNSTVRGICRSGYL